MTPWTSRGARSCTILNRSHGTCIDVRFILVMSHGIFDALCSNLVDFQTASLVMSAPFG